MIDIRLRVFQSVANNLSFTKASKELFKCQPAISRHIQELESEFNTRLFNRKSTSIELTDAGKLLLKHVNIILSDYEKLAFEMNALNEKFEGSLTIGASTTIFQYVLPQILAEFKKKFPDIKISTMCGNTDAIERAVLNHDVDIGMVEGIDTKTTLKYTPFMNDELVAFVKKGTELSNHNVITIKELKELPLILKDEGTVTRKLIEMQLEALGYSLDDFNVEMCFSDAESVKCFVENSESVGILSDKTIRSEISRKSLKKLKIKGLEFNRKFSFVERNQPEEGGPDQRFKSFTSSFFDSINLLKSK